MRGKPVAFLVLFGVTWITARILIYHVQPPEVPGQGPREIASRAVSPVQIAWPRPAGALHRDVIKVRKTALVGDTGRTRLTSAEHDFSAHLPPYVAAEADEQMVQRARATTPANPVPSFAATPLARSRWRPVEFMPIVSGGAARARKANLPLGNMVAVKARH